VLVRLDHVEVRLYISAKPSYNGMLQLRDNVARPDRNIGSNTGSTKMIVQLTKRERATILAALRRWLSYPAAREADSIATNGGKHKPLDNAEIDRLWKRIAELERKRDAAPLLRQSDNGARERKASKTRADMRTPQDSNHVASFIVNVNHGRM
jgi:hypothetical protein